MLDNADDVTSTPQRIPHVKPTHIAFCGKQASEQLMAVFTTYVSNGAADHAVDGTTY